MSTVQNSGVSRQVTRAKSKSDAVVKHQRVFVVLKTTSVVKQLFKSGAVPFYHSLVTSLVSAVEGGGPECIEVYGEYDPDLDMQNYPLYRRYLQLRGAR